MMVRNKNPEKSQQEARRGKMSFFAYFKEEFQVIQERDPAIQTGAQAISERPLLSGQVDFTAGSEKNRYRNPSGCDDRKGIVY